MPLFNLCCGRFHGRFETAGRLLPQPHDCKGRKTVILHRRPRPRAPSPLAIATGLSDSGGFISVTNVTTGKLGVCGFATITMWGSSLAQTGRNGASDAERTPSVFPRTTSSPAITEPE